MKIDRAELFRYRLNLACPLKLSASVLDSRRGILVRLTNEDGRVGWGEIAPLPGYSRESLDDATREATVIAHNLQSGPAINYQAGYPISSIFRFAEKPQCGSVKFGFECALLGLTADLSSVNLCELLGAAPTDSVPVNKLLVGERDTIIPVAQQAVRDGYTTLKLKVGSGSIDQSAELVRELSSITGDAAALRLDANRAWTFDEASRFASLILGCSVEYIEEPCRTFDDSLKLASDGRLPVALDESLTEFREKEDRFGTVAAFVIKPTIIGGTGRTIELCDLAAGHGIKPVISSSFESSVGRFYLTALAALAGNSVAAGLDTADYFVDDLLPEPIVAQNGRITLPPVSIMNSIQSDRLERVHND